MGYFLKYFDEYKNPLYYWWKVRKIFKRPKCHFIYGKDIWFFGMYICKEYYNPIIHIKFQGLGWKTKYGEYRHEWDPYIQICFFRKWHLIWLFNWVTKEDRDSSVRSIATWEAILDYLYNNKTIEECISNHTWESDINDNSHMISIKDNLK